MPKLSRKIHEKTPFGFHLLLCFLVAGIIFLAISPSIYREVWLDEASLFCNYPLKDITDAMHPLSLYDQAATPAYSILFGGLANLPAPLFRGVQLFCLLLSSVWIVSNRSRSIASAAIAGISISWMQFPLYYMAEMKHYGMEVIGGLVLFKWFIYRPTSEMVSWRDILILCTGLALGVSTIPIAGIVLISFAMVFSMERRFLLKSEIQTIVIIFAAAGLYLLLAKYVVSSQIAAYPAAYKINGLINRLNMLRGSLGQITSGKLAFVAVMGGAYIFLLSRASDPIIRKRVIVLTAVMISVLTISVATGHYPVMSGRHVVWMASYCWLIVFAASEGIVSKSSQSALPPADRPSTDERSSTERGGSQGHFIDGPVHFRYWAFTVRTGKRCLIIVFGGCILLVALRSLIKLNSRKYSNDNTLAVTEIIKNGQSPVGLFGAAQQIIEYNKRFSLALAQREYFGEFSRKSICVEKGRNHSMDPSDDLSERSRVWWNNHADWAKWLIANSPKQGEFRIFSDFVNEESRSQLEHSIDMNGIRIDRKESYGNAVIYTLSVKNKG